MTQNLIGYLALYKKNTSSGVALFLLLYKKKQRNRKKEAFWRKDTAETM